METFAHVVAFRLFDASAQIGQHAHECESQLLLVRIGGAVEQHLSLGRAEFGVRSGSLDLYVVEEAAHLASVPDVHSFSVLAPRFDRLRDGTGGVRNDQAFIEFEDRAQTGAFLAGAMR